MKSLKYNVYLQKILKLVPLFFILLFSFLNLYSQNAFIENKGQWDKNILYKVKFPTGACFIENNSFTFVFYSGGDFHKSKAHHNYSGNKRIDFVHFHAYRFSFHNSNITTPIPFNKEKDYENYFIGNDPKRWVSKVGRYKKLFFPQLYKNIDYQIHFNKDGNLQYDFIINPGGNPHDIKIKYEGLDSLYIDNQGNVVAKTSLTQTVELKPYAYQIINGKKVEVKCNFILYANKYVAFQIVDNYNENYDLIIDPTLIFSTYTGSSADNWGFTATFDSHNNAFSGGIVFDVGYPTSLGAFQINFAGGEPYNPNSSWYALGCDIGIIKYSSDGTQRLWATYLGGTQSEELPHSLVCNRSDDLIIMGTTGSSDFPVTQNAYDNTFNGGTTVLYDNVIRFGNGTDIFVTRLSSDGTTLIGSTFIGGSDNDGLNFRQYYENFIMTGNSSTLYYNYADGARGEVICDASNNIYVATCTFSSNFPTTTGAFDISYNGQQEGVVFKLNPFCSQLIWSSYFGGSDDDAIYSLDIDISGNVYIAGGTLSYNIPTTGGVLQPLNPGQGSVNGFIAKINNSGSSILRCTYWGTTAYDQIYFVRVDKQNNIYVAGQTEALGNVYIINTSFGTPGSGQFITKFNNNLSQVIWSTAFGTGLGRPNISLTAFSVDYCNRVYISGWGREWAGDWSQIQGTKNMYVTPDAFQSQTDGQDFYLMVLSEDASHVEYASFFGEVHYTSCGYSGHDHVDGGTSRFDKWGNIYQSVCASCGGCNQFPTYPNPGAWSNNNGNAGFNCNNALFKFSFALPLTVAHFEAQPVCLGDTMHFTNLSQMASQYYWDFGDGSSSTEQNPSHLYFSPGTYNVTLIAFSPNTCNNSDTVSFSVIVDNISTSTNDTHICQGEVANISVSANSIFFNVNYLWSTSSSFTQIIGNDSSIYVNPSNTTTYYVSVYNDVCSKIDSVKVNVHYANVDLQTDTIICSGNNFTINSSVNYDGEASYQWQPSEFIVGELNTSTPVISISTNTMFYVTITNSYGCKDYDSILVQIDDFSANILNIEPIKCHNDCNGKIFTAISGGVFPYTYTWNTGANTTNLTNLCAGYYSVTITDGIGCSYILDTFLVNPSLLVANISVISEAQCDSIHPNTGAISVSVTGGTEPYYYFWNTGMTASTISNLYAGTYIVTVIDNHGCDTIMSAVINDPSTMQILVIADSTKCYGSCDGAATVYVIEHGTPPYTYLWNTGDVTTNIYNLCSGIYSVTVKDAEYCYRAGYVYVPHPDSLNAILNIQPIKCYGATTNVTLYQITGGTPPYNYQWFNGTQNNPIITDMAAGTYWLSITDSHNCSDTILFNITEPPALIVDTNIIKPLCFESCNGKITLLPMGGSPPYTFNWNTGTTSFTVSNLCPGTYYVTISDANGCTIEQVITLNHQNYFPPLDATANPYIIYHGQTSQLMANTISENYHFLWWPSNYLSNQFLQNPKTQPPSTITYYVSVTDFYGCTNIDSVQIVVLDVICEEPYIYVPNAFTPNDDGINDILYVHAPMSIDIYFAIYDRWGECVFETTNINKGWNGTYKGIPLDPAVFVYYLKVKCLNNQYFEKKGNITLIR